MDVSSLILGFVVLVAVGILELNNRADKELSDASSDLDQKYFQRRKRQRRLVHCLMSLVAFLAITAGIAGPGRTFVLIWAAVPLVILLVVMLAWLDAYQTHDYHTNKIPELRDATLATAEAAGIEESESA